SKPLFNIKETRLFHYSFIHPITTGGMESQIRTQNHGVFRTLHLTETSGEPCSPKFWSRSVNDMSPALAAAPETTICFWS
ncbi:hypothetical protein, partial [Komagataeibacter sp. NFXK3]